MVATFRYRDSDFSFFDHPYNFTITNERSIEIPIASDFIARQDDPAAGLEIGNVMSHYVTTRHRIVDRYEQVPGVKNLDVFAVLGTYPWVLSVSTIEHVRTDEGGARRNPFGSLAALMYCMGLVAPGGTLMVTFPLHYNAALDDAVMNGHLPHATQWSQQVYALDDHRALTHPTGWQAVAHPIDLRTSDWDAAVWIGEWSA